MSKSAKAWAKKARVWLINELGGKCANPECPTQETEFEKLTIDHIYGKDYETTGLSTDQRMGRYMKEHRLGLIQCLCLTCNSKRGDPRDREMQEKVRLIFKLTNNDIRCTNGCDNVYVGDLDFVHCNPNWTAGETHGDERVALYAREMDTGRLKILCPECRGVEEAERQVIPMPCADVYELAHAVGDPF
jgi:hypothetical protein